MRDPESYIEEFNLTPTDALVVALRECQDETLILAAKEICNLCRFDMVFSRGYQHIIRYTGGDPADSTLCPAAAIWAIVHGRRAVTP